MTFGSRASKKGDHVTVVHFPGPTQQMPAYTDCVRRFGKQHSYMAFMDVDEFLVLKNEKHVIPFLNKYLPMESDFVELSINWYFFFMNNQTTYRPLPVTKRFLYRDGEVNQHVKSILKMKDAFCDRRAAFYNPHYCRLKPGQLQVDTNGKSLGNSPFNPGGPTDVAVIHHYVTKSREEYIAKYMRGRSDIHTRRSIEDAEKIANLTMKEHMFDSTYDDSAWVRLKEMVPEYRMFDSVYDDSKKMVQEYQRLYETQ